MGATENFFAKKRKWSIIKDNILQWYLTPYISKILYTQKPLVLVDCFAGKGKFDDGEDGSPLIIAKKIQAVLNADKSKKIGGIFIENKYGKFLKDNLQGFSNCKVIEGTFEDNFDGILKPGRNIFLYIDPYGIKSLDFSRFEKLRSTGFNSYEMLMNFNSFGFLREGCRMMKYNYAIESDNYSDDDELLCDVDNIDIANGKRLLNTIADGDYWQDILAEYHKGSYDMYRAEELFVYEYMKNLKAKNIFKYTVNIPVKLKTRNIPKYRLIFGTNHHQGLFLMCNNMNKQWLKILDEQRNGQQVLFEYDYPDRGIIREFDLGKGITAILSGSNGFISLIDLYCKLIEKFGIAYSESDFKTALKELESQGMIKVNRRPTITPKGKPVTSFDYTKYIIEVKLSK